MKRRLLSVAGVLLLVTTMLVGLQPAAADPGVQSMTGTMAFDTPPAVGANYCKTISGPVLTTLTTTTFAGPIAGNGTGTICGTWPLFLNGTLDVTGTVNQGPVTANMHCSGSITGIFPGTTTYKLDCLLTVTTPFGTTNQTLCVEGLATLIAYPGVIYIGYGISQC